MAPGAAYDPIVHVKNGEVFANSRDVAEFFGKAHYDVLKDIDRLKDQMGGIGKSSDTPLFIGGIFQGGKLKSEPTPWFIQSKFGPDATPLKSEGYVETLPYPWLPPKQ